MIAYLFSRFPVISETFILYEALELMRQGWPVELRPLRLVRYRTIHPDAQRLLSQIRVTPLLSLSVIASNVRQFCRRPRRYVSTLWEVAVGSWGNANFLLGSLVFFPMAVHQAYELERSGVKHIHAHFATHATTVALIIHRLTDIPFSFTAHGSDLHVCQRMLDRKTLAAAVVVTISSYNKEFLIKAVGEWARPKVYVVNCGVDLTYFGQESKDDLKADVHPLRIVCVASLREVKGHRYLIQACESLQQKGVSFQCRLIGEGPLESEIRRQIKSTGLESSVRILGSMPRDAVLEALQWADVAVLASIKTKSGSREGIPVALMEAMALERPVVASRLSGIPELVTDGVEGILVEPGDGNALAEALAHLAGDSELRRRMGKAGRRKVESDFDLKKNAIRLVDLLCDQSPALKGAREIDINNNS